MTVLDLLHYPDARLRRLSDDILDFDDPLLQSCVDDLLETMYAHPGCIGLAAPQVDRPIQLLVIDCGLGRKPMANHHGLLVICNPEILTWSEMAVAREGCLSLPDYTGNVVRAVRISLRYQDRMGQTATMESDGFEARVIQHEMDHLEGKLFIDRVVSRKADLFQRKSYLARR